MKNNQSLFLFLLYFILLANVNCKKKATSIPIVTKPQQFLNDVFFVQKATIDSSYLKQQLAACPTIAMSDKGELFVAWFCSDSTMVEGPGNYIAISYSADTGKTWKKNVLFITPSQKSDRFFDPILFKDGQGEVVLTFARCKDYKLWDGNGGVWATGISYDIVADTVVYTIPQFLFRGVMNNKPIINKVNGSGTDGVAKIIYPVAVWGTTILVYESDNVILKDIFPVFKSQIPMLDNGVYVKTEPSLTYINDTVGFLALIRDQGWGMGYSQSIDLVHWPTAQRYSLIGDNPSSRHFITRLSSGNLLLIANSSKEPVRSHLTAFLSTNNGVSWNYKLLIDAREHVSYPDAVQERLGNIYMVYDFNRVGKAKEIDFVKFTENDIIQGNKLKIENIQ